MARLHNAEGNWPKARGLLRDLVTTVNRTPLYLMAYAEGLIANREFAETQNVVAKLEALEQGNKAEQGAYGTVQLRALLLEANNGGDKAVALIREYVRRPGAQPDEFLLLVRYLSCSRRSAVF